MLPIQENHMNQLLYPHIFPHPLLLLLIGTTYSNNDSYTRSEKEVHSSRRGVGVNNRNFGINQQKMTPKDILLECLEALKSHVLLHGDGGSVYHIPWV